jgi:hypothetical protein
MVKCPFCHATHVDNTIFCSECGTYLLEDDERETDRLNESEIGWVGEDTDDSGIVSSVQAGPRPIAIRLRIGSKKREVELPLNRVIHIGRVDPAENTFPELDLTEDSRQSKRVSRRHARILKQGDTVIVEDIGSVNGTFINGKRLDPYVPEVLNDGDTLQFGTLLAEVKVLKR